MTTAIAEPQSPQTETLDSEKAMAGDREKVRSLATEERKRSIANRLEIGRIVGERMEANVKQFSKVRDDNANVRSQTAKLFAIDLTQTYGVGHDDNEVNRLVKASILRDLLPPDAAKDLEELAWDTARVLTRWVEHKPDDGIRAISFMVTLGVPDDEGKTTKRIDATPILIKLVGALAKSPKSAAAVRKILDQAEVDARDAELAFLNSKKQAKARTIIEDNARRARIAERSQFFDGLAKRIGTLGLTTEEITTELYRVGIMIASSTDIDPSKLADLDATDAKTIGQVLLNANNIDAIAALMEAFAPLVQEVKNNVQPSGKASVTLTREVHSVAA